VNSNHPEFDSHRYTVHDLAKHVIIHELEQQGWLNVHVNPDTYGPDLIATSSRSGNTWTIEVEVKNNWNTGHSNTDHYTSATAKPNGTTTTTCTSPATQTGAHT